MKNIVRKSMFVLSFLGLFTFATPNQSYATNDCPTYHVCCGCDCDGDGKVDCFDIPACTPQQLQGFVELLCNISVTKVEK